jgi:hypothetical protein
VPKGFDDKLSVQLITECESDQIQTRSSHKVTLDNNTRQTLYDVTFVVSIDSWDRAHSRLNISREGNPPSGAGSLGQRSGALPADKSIKETFDLTPQGMGRRTESISTTGDWTLSVNTPITGIPPGRRDSRSCEYSVTIP